MCDLCSEANSCQQCSANYEWTGSECTYICPDNCSECEGELCKSCKEGFALKVDQSDCETCPAGTFLEEESCVACPSNCKECSDGVSCDLCDAGYELSEEAQCSTCSDGYALNTDGKCEACSDGC